MRRKSNVSFGPGAASLILIVVILSMSVLGMLALMNARNDDRLSSRSIDVIRHNLAVTGFMDRVTLLQADAETFVRNCRAVFDIAFLDPPYDAGLLQKVLPILSPKMARGGVILCESPVAEVLPEEIGDYRIFRTYRYGKTKITAYRDVDV